MIVKKFKYGIVILFYVIFSLFSLSSCVCKKSDKSPVYYRLNLQAEHGSVTADPDLPEYPAGSKVTITAASEDGYDFSSWTGDETGGENPFSFIMDSDKSITAVNRYYNDINYYVDFENGDDNNNGLSASTAWKHAPGDINAKGVAASIDLLPGNRLLFKGGVVYRGQIKIPSGGTLNHHVIYRGNGWPELENTKAVIDGGDVVTGWVQCASAAECYGKSNYNSMYYAWLPADIDPLSANLHEYNASASIDEFLWPSQSPDPSDFYFYDNMNDFRKITQTNLSRTSITDAEIFNQSDADYWSDSYLLIWINPNRVETRKILSYNPVSNTVTFADLGENAMYPDGRDQAYAVFNSPHAIDKPGEYFISTTPDSQNRLKILLWPRSGTDPGARITYSARRWGIDINSRSNVTVEGFSVIKHSGTELRDGVGIGTITASSLENYNLLVKNNYITHNRKGGSPGYGGIYLQNVYNTAVLQNEVLDNPKHAGIFVSGGARVTVKGNSITRSGSTSLRFYTVEHGIIDGNTISESKGSHANGITIYMGSENILVANNRVVDCSSPITLQDSGNLWFINNMVDAYENTSNVNEWGETSRGPWKRGIISFLNNTFIRNSRNSALNIGGASAENSYISINNIIDGGAGHSSIFRSNNLYTGLGWSQSPAYNWSLSAGEFVNEDLSVIFANPAAQNYRLAPGSPAINAGADITPYLPRAVFPEFDFTRDIEGKVRTGHHIGAYGYQ